jgi:hypothetical protein
VNIRSANSHAYFDEGTQRTKEAMMQIQKGHKILRAIALGLLVAAVTAPTALADPRGLAEIDPLIADAIRANQAQNVAPDDRPIYRGKPVESGALDPLIGDAIRASQAQNVGTSDRIGPAPVPLVRSGGFDWEDAVIGATFGLALALLVGGAALVATQHRRSLRSA